MKENLLVLTGPTGIGKTSLSIELATSFEGEIISADSMQIYKYMNIGTAKIKEEEMKGIPHYMVDIVYPDEDFTVSNYRDKAKENIENINSKRKLPIVVGGTGLYINSLVYDLNFASVAPNTILREKYEQIIKDKGNKYLHDLLYNIDRDSAERINMSDVKRVMRALEIYEATGKTMSEYNKNFRKENNDYNLIMICLNMDRATLYERINKRVDLMIEEGLVEEVKNILKMGYNRSLISLQGIGYKEIIMYLDGEISLNDAIESIKKASRNYAKRQLTWFRRDKRINWVDLDEFSRFQELNKNVSDYIKRKLYK